MGITDRLDKIEKKMLDEEIEAAKKQKKFKLPFGTKVSPAKAKKNFITLMKINENRSVEFKKIMISEQSFIENGIPRLGTADYVLMHKKNPMIVLPAWSVKPFSPTEQYEKSMTDGSNTKGYKILLEKSLLNTSKPKKDLGIIKWLFLAACAGIIIYAFIG